MKVTVKRTEGVTFEATVDGGAPSGNITERKPVYGLP